MISAFGKKDKRRRKPVWGDFSPAQRSFMANNAMKADAASQLRLDDLRRDVLNPMSTNTTFHMYEFKRPEGLDVMKSSERRKFLKQARRDWKRSTVKRTVNRRIDGTVDVTLSRRRGMFDGGGIENAAVGANRTTVASYAPDGKGGMRETYNYFRDHPNPADVARVFGIQYESAFDNLPPRGVDEADAEVADGNKAVKR